MTDFCGSYIVSPVPCEEFIVTFCSVMSEQSFMYTATEKFRKSSGFEDNCVVLLLVRSAPQLKIVIFFSTTSLTPMNARPAESLHFMITFAACATSSK